MNTLDNIAQSAYSYRVTIDNSYNLAKEVIEKNIAGDIFECGIAAGSQLAAMSLAVAELNSEKILYGYDSFEGIPLAGEFDTQQPGIGDISHDKFLPLEQRLVSSTITSHSYQEVVANFERWGLPQNNLRFIKGWFQHTLPENQIEKISLLRLDGDLYESTMICLEYLYPKVSKGGVVIIDDYALDGCRTALEKYFKKMPKLISVDGEFGGGVVYFYKD